MKKLLLSAGLILSACLANAQWLNQNAPFTYEGYINTIKVANATTVWGTTYSNATGTLTPTKEFVRTIDGGANWNLGVINSTPAALRPANLYPINGDTCYTAMYNPTAAGGKVYKTINGGTSWTQVGSNMFTQPSSFANFVYFWNAQNGMAMGDPAGSPLKYEIYLTTDFGATWVATPAANLPTLTDPAEYGITNLYDAVDGHVWFGTTYGDVYHSADQGVTWTKSVTGLPANPGATGGRFDITNVAFTDSMHGLVSQTNTSGYILISTNDGGVTWTTVTPTGNFFYGDISGVPGSDIFVSCGSSTGNFGSSFSVDNGLTWVDLDASSHTAVDFLDSLTGFSGEYIPAGGPGGVWEFSANFNIVACGSASISSGIGATPNALVCFGDTVVFSVAGIVPPTEGTTHGFGVLVSTADLLGSNDPLSDPSVLGGTQVIGYPADPFVTALVNDGAVFPAGIYYFTPVVFGNAQGTGSVTGLTLDPACTLTGASTMINMLVDQSPLCPSSSIVEIKASALSMSAFFNANSDLNLTINSKANSLSTLAIYDITGRNVYSTTLNIVNGTNQLVMNVGTIGSGTYLVKLTNDNGQATTRLIKL